MGTSFFLQACGGLTDGRVVVPGWVFFGVVIAAFLWVLLSVFIVFTVIGAKLYRVKTLKTLQGS
jgi:hypothetical protein